MNWACAGTASIAATWLFAFGASLASASSHPAREPQETRCLRLLLEQFAEIHRDPYLRNGVELEQLAERFARLRGKELEALQSKALRDNLVNRGAPCRSADGFSCLRKVSAANRKRLLGGFTLEKAEREAPGARKLYDKLSGLISFHFVHNSHHLPSKTVLPIVSSKQIERMGLRGGANTGGFSGKAFLKGDDQVFFHVQMRAGRETPDPKSFVSPYGKVVGLLDSGYADKNAWVSPFIMYEHEMDAARFALFGDREVSRRTVLKNLHRLDFTVTDFRETFILGIVKKVMGLRSQDSVLYEKMIRSLDADTAKDKAMNSAFSAMLGFGSKTFSGSDEVGLRFELKVPVAVPREKIRIF